MSNEQQDYDDLLQVFLALGLDDEYFPTQAKDVAEKLTSVLGLASGLIVRRTVTDLSDEDVERYLNDVLEQFELDYSTDEDSHRASRTPEGRRDQLISLLLSLETIRNG